MQCGRTGRNAILGQQLKGARLVGCSSHILIQHVVVPFDSKQRTQLIESINLEYISLGNCPALTALQEDR